MSRYLIGNTYFKVDFYDEDCKYPEISSLIFIGKNLDDLDRTNEDVWFFQDSESFLDVGPSPYNEDGSLLKELPEGEKSTGKVYSCKEDCLDLFLNVNELIERLSSW